MIPSLRSSGQSRDVLAPLAASLALLPWEFVALADHLEQRLPARQRRMALPLARALTGRFPGGVAPDAALILDCLAGLPQGRRILAFARRHGQRPAYPLDPPAFRPDPALAGLPLPPLATTADLAEFLAISPEQLVRFTDLRALSALSPDRFGGHYRFHVLPKASGGARLIEEPKPFLKALQRRVLAGILDQVPPHPAAHGFRKGRSCIGAAAAHAGEAMVLCFDLADFFPAFGFARVYGLFRALGFPAGVARALAGLCTAVTPPAVLAGDPGWTQGPLRFRHLPQGAPTSPALANLMAFALDRRLAGLARSLDATYTRYADDLAFSGDARIAPVLLDTLPGIVAEEGFRLNPGKTRVQPASGRQVVTGLVVNSRVNPPRAELDLLKATLHRLGDPADPRRGDAGFLAQLSGRIGWVEQVNPGRGARLRAAYDGLGIRA